MIIVVCKLLTPQSKKVGIELASKYEMISCDLTLSRSLFYSTGAVVAQPCLPMAFLGQTEETYTQFPCVRLLDLIRADK